MTSLGVRGGSKERQALTTSGWVGTTLQTEGRVGGCILGWMSRAFTTNAPGQAGVLFFLRRVFVVYSCSIGKEAGFRHSKMVTLSAVMLKVM